ncbi:MAG: hypothetical protein WAV89_12795 [Ignavibacteriaceae bacterium]
MKPHSYLHKLMIIPLMFILALSIIIGTSCQKQGPTQVEVEQAPIQSNAPFYSGTIRFTQLPTPANPNIDLIVDFTATFRPDSNGNWPMIDFDPPTYSTNLEQINTGMVKWGISISYSDSILNGRAVPKKVLLGMTSRYILDTLIHLTGEVTRSYRITIPYSTFSQYAQTSDTGDLYISLNVFFNGAKLHENSSLNDILYKTDYSSIEHIEYTPATGRIYYASEGAPQNPALKIIQ